PVARGPARADGTAVAARALLHSRRPGGVSPDARRLAGATHRSAARRSAPAVARRCRRPARLANGLHHDLRSARVRPRRRLSPTARAAAVARRGGVGGRAVTHDWIASLIL